MIRRLALFVLVGLIAVVVRAEDVAPKLLFDPTTADAGKQLAFNGNADDVTFKLDGNAIDVTVVANGKTSFPGVAITPPAPWDASGFGHIEATVTNAGTKPIRVSLRLDNDGPWQDNPWSAAFVSLKPGETKPVAAVFGYQYGKKGYALKPNAINRAILFTSKSDVEQHWRVEKIQAAGPAGEKPYVDPNTVSVKPAGGVLLDANTVIDAKQVVGRAGAKAAVAEGGKSLTIETAKSGNVLFKPVAGMWNLNPYLQVRLKLKNTGAAPAKVSAQLQSRAGAGETVSADIAAGGESEIVLPFMASKPCKLPSDPGQLNYDLKKSWLPSPDDGGTLYASNTTTGVLITVEGAANLTVTSILADMPPRQPLPEWLGKRPPVDGEWTQTLDENFDGDQINNKLWNNYTEGEWHLGKETAYSKDNVIVKDGKLHLRVEKRPAHHNDNDKLPLSQYATGWCDSYGKWTQRYGYFEARMKLPTADSAFTAFWLMPDRGIDTTIFEGEERKLMRNSTNGHGMEYDIMETLAVWGPNRHDFGMHWDHYEKNHKSIGTFACYTRPDEEGYITVGILWTPGKVVMYDNGREAASWETPRISTIPSYLILQHITGGWEGDPIDDSQLPSDYTFDWVRVWQRKDLASPVDGPKPNEGGPLPPKKK